MADRLLKRRLQLSPAAGADLIRLLNAPPLSSAHEQSFEYLFPVFKLVEASFEVFLPGPLRQPLRELRCSLLRPIPAKAWERRKGPKVSKRNQNICQRISKMLEDP
jgi:hypothetical protein